MCLLGLWTDLTRVKPAFRTGEGERRATCCLAMSTLIGWMKFAVIDLDMNNALCDRFLSYRGGTDEAWQRATRGMLRDIENHCCPP